MPSDRAQSAAHVRTSGTPRTETLTPRYLSMLPKRLRRNRSHADRLLNRCVRRSLMLLFSAVHPERTPSSNTPFPSSLHTCCPAAPSTIASSSPFLPPTPSLLLPSLTFSLSSASASSLFFCARY